MKNTDKANRTPNIAQQNRFKIFQMEKKKPIVEPGKISGEKKGGDQRKECPEGGPRGNWGGRTAGFLPRRIGFPGKYSRVKKSMRGNPEGGI